PFVMTARNEVEKVLLEVCPCAGNCVHFILPNHFRERNAQFGGAHCTGERDHHFPTTIQMRRICIGCVFQSCRVEGREMPINELADAAHLHFINSSSVRLDLMQKLYRDSQALITLFCRNLLRHSSKNSRRQDIWHYTKKENCCSEYGHRDSSQQIGREAITR